MNLIKKNKENSNMAIVNVHDATTDDGKLSENKSVSNLSIYNFFKNQTHKNKEQVFEDKLSALDYIGQNPNLNLFLFSEDVAANCGAKRYYATTHETIHTFSAKKIYHLYENYEKEEPIKLFLDIDLKEEHIPTNFSLKAKEMLFNTTVNTSIDLMIIQLAKYNIEEDNIKYIVLTSSRKDKYSAHVIFPNIVFNDVYTIKYFMMDIKSKLIDEKIIDLSVYRAGCFRLLWNSKSGKNHNLEYHKSTNYDFLNNKELFMDCLVRNIDKASIIVPYKIPTNLVFPKAVKKAIRVAKKPGVANDDVPIASAKKRIPKAAAKIIVEENADVEIIPIDTIKKYLNLISIKRADNYGDWIEIGIILHGCNPSKACFELWDSWSKNSVDYDGIEICMYKWLSFKHRETGIGSLKYLAKKDNHAIYLNLEFGLEKPIFTPLQFETNYLTDKDKKMIPLVSEHVEAWYKGGNKVLSVLSPYDTAKTSMLKDILTKYKPKKVLFISYRQTLTYDLYGVFSEFGFANYLDKIFDANRLICQLDSLPGTLIEYKFDDVTVFPKYDLVICDEIESLLAHFSSTFIGEKQKLFDLFVDILHCSKKIIALDGDFGNRSFKFLEQFTPKQLILQNTVQKNLKHFIFSNKKTDFESQIEADLAAGKKVVCVSMSNTICTYLYNKFKDKYKVVVHCADSDSQLKKELQNVNSFWNTFDLVIYSPCVEAGVSFDQDYFDKIYVCLCAMSTSPRGLMQMINRVRKIKDNNIFVYLNNLPFREKANFYSFEEVSDYVYNISKKYIEKKRVLDENKQPILVRQYKCTPYYTMLIYNEMERLNKSPPYFVAYLIQLMLNKGHTYDDIDSEFNKKNFKKETIKRDELLEAELVNDEVFSNLMTLQKMNETSHEQKIQIEKYMYSLNWKTNKLDNDFFTKFYGKTYILFNLRYYLDETKINPYLTLEKENDSKVVDFDKIAILERIRMLKQIMLTLGFKKVDPKIKIKRVDFETRMKLVVTKCDLFTNKLKSQPLFELPKKKIHSIKSFLGFINTILSDWGLVIKTKQILKTVKNVSIANHFYCLNYLNNIDTYL